MIIHKIAENLLKTAALLQRKELSEAIILTAACLVSAPQLDVLAVSPFLLHISLGMLYSVVVHCGPLDGMLLLHLASYWH